jgi:hypothetical protein
MRVLRGFGVWRGLMILLGLALMVAACGDSDDDSSSASLTEAVDDSSEDEAMGVSTEGEAADTAASLDGDDAAGGLGIPAALQPTDIGRSIVFTARLEVVVDDVVGAGDSALQAMEGIGGLLFGQRTESDPRPRTVLIFKVAPNDFGEALDRLGRIGDIREQEVTADDVTERIVDLDSRILSSEASVTRLRTFLEAATNVNDVAELERELLERETRLELLRGQRRTIQGQVDLATITLTISQRVPEPAMDLNTSFIRGLDRTCPGVDEVRVEEDEEFAVCLHVENTGDTVLTDVALADSLLDLDRDDFELVRGDAGEFAPGQRRTYRAVVSLDGSRFTNTIVTAVGASDRDVGVVARDGVLIEVKESDSLPGFVDGLGAAWQLVQAFIGVIVLLAGFAIPLLWIPLLAFGLYRLIRWLVRR